MRIEYSEIVGATGTADVTIGSTGLRRVALTGTQERQVMAEIEQWDLIRDVKGCEELYWHNNDVIDHSGRDHIMNYRGSGSPAPILRLKIHS